MPADSNERVSDEQIHRIGSLIARHRPMSQAEWEQWLAIVSELQALRAYIVNLEKASAARIKAAEDALAVYHAATPAVRELIELVKTRAMLTMESEPKLLADPRLAVFAQIGESK